MNNFDIQRIENAIWILSQYEYELKEKMQKDLDLHAWDCNKVFDILEEIKAILN